MDVDKPSNVSQDTATASSGPNPDTFDSSINTQGGTHKPPNALPALVDIVETIPGMYRILDLVSEQGSGGLVDKVIISQASFGRFVDDICPGAYQSMTRVNFEALDDLSVRPLGIYGSKSEIVRYLKDLDLITDVTYHSSQVLLTGQDDMPATRALRSGLYVLLNAHADVVYAIFWPQDTTWDDDAISSVARNRVTFMRYLTKIADQIIALVPDDYSDSMVLAEEAPAESFDVDGVDRLFTFEVRKTREEEENVTATEGFKVLSSLCPHGIAFPFIGVSRLLHPRLVYGETCLGIMSISYQKPITMERWKTEEFSRTRLLEFIKKESFVLSRSLSEDAFKALVEMGLAAFAQDEYQQLDERRNSLTADLAKREKEVSDKLESTLLDQNLLLVDALFMEAAAVVTGTIDELRPEQSTTVDHVEGMSCRSFTCMMQLVNAIIATKLLEHLSALYPPIRKLRSEMLSDQKLKTIGVKGFASRKEKLIKSQTFEVQGSSSPAQSEKDPEEITEEKPEWKPSWASVVAGTVSKTISAFVPGPVFRPAYQAGRGQKMPSNVDFLRMLPDIISTSPELAAEAQEAIAIGRQHFTSHISTSVNKVAKKIEDLQRTELKNQQQAHCKHAISATRDDSRKVFIESIQTKFFRDPDNVFVLNDVRDTSAVWSAAGSFRLTGTAQWKNEASLKHAISLLHLTETDKHAMQLDKTHVPTPRLQTSTCSFNLTFAHRILLIQLLHDSRCLLIIRDEIRGDVSIYFEKLVDLDNAVKYMRPKKTFSASKLHGELLFSFDETKRTLAVCVVAKLHVHAFVFDEHYRNLQGLGSTIELSPWYDQHIKLVHMIFRCGADEELLLVDNTGRARILSLTTQQFRPASLQLPSSTRSLKSSPDGSCFFVVEPLLDRMNLQAYHWASFGSSQGFNVELPAIPIDSLQVTTFANRTRCHVTILSIASATVRSIALHISHKSTEFTFRADDRNIHGHQEHKATAHNAIIDCHRDVWTRFPVVPAVRRHTYKSSKRAPRSLTFVSYLPSQLFSTYFSDMIGSFERATHKPVEDELASVTVSGISFPAFMKQSALSLSQLRAGEWLVDILCLIPIHIAVARDNRFVPLKDGVWSPDFERALLGATVEQVVDKLSFGCREQSVGKSFALNHLADTSFAGSAMRTTEGVWMSVTPTEQCLIVALDFEGAFSMIFIRATGVHSIERSAQEDSLLVLFNTAISNLTNDWGALDQNLVTHRALHLQTILPLAMQFGASEVEPDHEPLKDIDNGVSLALPHGISAKFYLPIAGRSGDTEIGERCLESLRKSWDRFQSRDGTADRGWTDGLDQYLEGCVKTRIEDVQYWLDVNTTRFSSDATTFQALRRQFETLAVALRAGVQLCKLQCAECQLYCIKSRHHASGHDCGTSHRCMHICAFPDEHAGENSACGLPAGHSGQHICDITLHLCGQPCRLWNLLDHVSTYRSNRLSTTPKTSTYAQRLLTNATCQEHNCTALCQSAGICRIETAPQSVEATFTGRHETFQYTKVRLVFRVFSFRTDMPINGLSICKVSSRLYTVAKETIKPLYTQNLDVCNALS
ncbi:uncharacterized protein PHACADRAFT_87023 [Phanerochaete carnosa HHB-10118-sp]|uniref:Uncharacterized protein n=1 Tax=Phanerochaete carnosa (strain HHB-10118-sp) TaxID=650164 RepID=K5WJL0_PHACS|nr:uncharacterized protein PHACADRAFT_87023 [Phanerochaete carnosa HHB-10118-sp]EKM59289.1 hypothetical protein PHACADRAFT_87023 [Phanerochaete carnosa HHB-10118-sp]